MVLRPAAGTPTEDRQMTDVSKEALALIQRRYQRPDRGFVDLGDLPATLANKVHVLGLGRQVVAGSAVPEVGVGDEAEVLKELERPVDGRDVHSPGGLPDVGEDLLRSRVLQPGNGL